MNNKNKPTIYSCSFCRKSQNQIKRLIAGPKGVFVCNECVETFANEIKTRHEQNGMGRQHEPRDQGLHCSFCRKDQAQLQYLSRSGTHGTRICSECIELCQEIFAEEQREQQAGRLEP